MEQRAPFDSQYGVLRLASARQGAPTAQAAPTVAVQQDSGLTAGVSAGGGPTVPGGDIVDAEGNPVSQEQLAAAKQAADAGDSNAAAWIAGITVAGVAGGALYAAMRNKGAAAGSPAGQQQLTLDASGRPMMDAEFEDIPTNYLPGRAGQQALTMDQNRLPPGAIPMGGEGPVIRMAPPKQLAAPKPKPPVDPRRQAEEDAAYDQRAKQNEGRRTPEGYRKTVKSKPKVSAARTRAEALRNIARRIKK
jgi:hypothetical protein